MKNSPTIHRGQVNRAAVSKTLKTVFSVINKCIGDKNFATVSDSSKGINLQLTTESGQIISISLQEGGNS